MSFILVLNIGKTSNYNPGAFPEKEWPGMQNSPKYMPSWTLRTKSQSPAQATGLPTEAQ